MKEIAKTDGIRVNCICPAMVDTPPVREMLAREPPMMGHKLTEYFKSTMLRSGNFLLVRLA